MFIAIGAASTAAAVDVVLRERVAPQASVVRLGDVAEVTTTDRQLARYLEKLPLMPAPASERFLRTREIQDMLAAQGVDLGTLRFSGAEQVAITTANGTGISGSGVQRCSYTGTPMNRRAAILAGATGERPAATGQLDEARTKELRDSLSSTIRDYLNAKTGKVVAWRIDCDVAERQLGQLSAATSPPVCSGGSEPWTGRQRFLVSLSTQDGPVQLPVFAEVAPPPVPAVVAVRPIARGDVIKAVDIELRTLDAPAKAAGQRAVVDSVEKLIGMEARQSIQAGDIVFVEAVQSPIMVKRGDIVTVTSQSGGIRVRTTARALHDGAHGELVQVESLGSREKYDARIVGQREVAVFAMSRPKGPEPRQPVRTARR